MTTLLLRRDDISSSSLHVHINGILPDQSNSCSSQSILADHFSLAAFRHIRDVDTMLVQCWTSVTDGDPILKRHDSALNVLASNRQIDGGQTCLDSQSRFVCSLHVLLQDDFTLAQHKEGKQNICYLT